MPYADPQKRICIACSSPKPLDDFPLLDREAESRAWTCRDCQRPRWRRSYLNRTPEQRQRNNAQKLRSLQMLRETDPKALQGLYRQRNLAKYGLTVQQFWQMVEEQCGQCAVCDDPLDFEASRRVMVDHCHETGKVRGILCAKCNVGMGIMGDDPRRMRAAADYLERSAALRAIAR